MEIREHLLTWEEYNKKEFDVPYVFKIEKDNQLLIYFGASHTNDKNDEQFVDLNKSWEEFVENANPNKIVFLEGGHGKEKYLNEEEAIEKHGEAGFVCHKANVAGMAIISPEPEEHYSLNELLKKYSKDEILCYRSGLIFLQWNRQINKPDPKEYLEKFMTKDCESAGWEVFTYEKLQEVHKKLYKTEFNPEDNGHFYKQVAPNEFNSVTNEISREEDIYRDVAVIDKALEYWNKGYSIFITYGSGHAVIQEPALKYVLK